MKKKKEEKKERTPAQIYFTKVNNDIKKRGVLWGENYIKFLNDYKLEVLYQHGITRLEAIEQAQSALADYKTNLEVAKSMRKR